jgi:hypothetical protein
MRRPLSLLRQRRHRRDGNVPAGCWTVDSRWWRSFVATCCVQRAMALVPAQARNEILLRTGRRPRATQAALALDDTDVAAIDLQLRVGDAEASAETTWPRR